MNIQPTHHAFVALSSLETDDAKEYDGIQDYLSSSLKPSHSEDYLFFEEGSSFLPLEERGHVSQTSSALKLPSINDLPMTFELRVLIHDLMEFLATKNIVQLTFEASYLSEIEYRVKTEVHPYLFLLEILKSSPLKEDTRPPKDYLEKIYTDYKQEQTHLFKIRSYIWNDFVQSLGENLKSQAGHLDPYRKTFAEALSLDPERIEQYETAENWLDLILYLAQFK